MQQFAARLQKLAFNNEVHNLVVKPLKASHAVERDEHAQAISRLTGEISRLTQRLDTVYVDKLIGEDHYYRISNQRKDELRRCEEDLTRFQEANHTYMDDGVALLRLAREAHNIFESHEGATRRKLLTFVLSNCTWKWGVLTAEFRQPFNLLEESFGQLFDENGPNGYNDAKKDNWLGN